MDISDLSSNILLAGSYVTFGRYPQNSADNSEPIEWLVLENIGETALLISRYCLDCKPFHHDESVISWRDCSLRKWLNGKFLCQAFNDDEITRIADNEVYTDVHEEYSTRDSGWSRDKVFLLSIKEAEKYFKDDYGRKSAPTFFAEEQGAWRREGDGGCWYWLRSPGTLHDFAADVDIYGGINSFGSHFFNSEDAVRPVLRIIL